MTAQISDTFFYENDKYSIIALQNHLEFNPEDYGITPQFCCTACWRGYYCKYRITKEGIFLKDLFINSDEYPTINGVNAYEGKKFEYMGHHLYKDINIKINYTGGILIGKGFLDEYYIHMGFQRPYAYKTVKELIFQNGNLINQIDYSKDMEQMRKNLNDEDIQLENKNNGYNLVDAIEESFSLDYKDKWFIKS